MEYIQLKVGSPHLKVLTSHGNLLSSLNITTELTDKVGGVNECVPSHPVVMTTYTLLIVVIVYLEMLLMFY